MQQLIADRRNIFIAIFCLLGFSIDLIAFYPGFASPDTVDVYTQALHGQYSDWHPPVMALLWRCLNCLYTGPQLMLVFQLGLLWSSCYILLRSVQYKYWYLCIALFAWAPFVQNFAGYLIKDSQMALSLLLATAILFRAGVRGKMNWLETLIAAFAIIYGGIVRPNAFSAVLPLCLLFAIVSTPRRNERYVRALGLLTLLLLCGKLQYQLPNTDKKYPQHKLYMHDLAGIFVATGENVFPAVLYTEHGFDTAYIREHYNTATFDNVWWNEDGKNVIPERTATVNAILFNAWKQSILTYPAVYLKNRADGFLYYLRLKDRHTKFYFLAAWPARELPGYVNKKNFISQQVNDMVYWHKHAPFVLPWFWFFLNIVLLFFIPLFKRGFYKTTYICLVSSGLLYQLPSFFIFQADTDFRYFYWNCIACSMAIILLVCRKHLPFINE